MLWEVAQKIEGLQCGCGCHAGGVIIVDEDISNDFSLDLVFNEMFNGNAFVQKREDGSFYVFIPDTSIPKNGVKVLYKDRKYKGIIKIGVEESTYSKDNSSDANYVKLSVNTIGNRSIQLYTKTLDEFEMEPPIKSFGTYNIIAILLFLIAGILICRILLLLKRNRNSVPKYKISVPKYSTARITNTPSYNTEELTTSNPITNDINNEDNNSDNHILPKVNIKKSMKSSEGEAFSCFDIPFAGEPDASVSSIELKKQSSSLQSKSKMTNPIIKKNNEEPEFSMPVVEDLAPTQTKKEIDNKKNTPELLSELKITPRKGFYLTTIDDTFALFGFVDSNVFLLKKFRDLSQINLQARFYDRQQAGDLYIVRLDSYKAMIEISDNGMRELAVL